MKINYKIIFSLSLTLLTSFAWAMEKDSLNHYLQIAAESNPEVRASFATYQATWQKVPQVRALDDPTLDVGFFFKPMDIVGGRQVADFTIMQMFPWFGTKKAARNEVTYMAKASYEQFREVRDKVFLQVYTQWYKILALQEQLTNNQENKKLLEQVRLLAQRRFASPQSSPQASYTPPSTSTTSSVSSGSSSSGMSGMAGMGSSSSPAASTTSSSGMSSNNMADMGSGMSGSSASGMSEVLRIELEIMELDDNMQTILANLNTEIGVLNTLLNRSINSPLTLPKKIDKVDFILEENMEEKLITQNPMLAMLEKEQQAYREMGKMNKRMGMPMIGIGLQYMLINRTSDPMFGMGSMNGDDMIMPMISLSLPIYRGKYKAQQKESKLRQRAAQETYFNTLNNLNSQVNLARNSLNDALRKIDLYKKQSDLAETTFQLSLKEFVVGKTYLTNIIQIHRQLLDYKLKEAEAIANYNTQVATIQSTISFNYIIKGEPTL